MDKTKIENIELDSVHGWDYPDFTDAYISYAEIDGEELTDKQYEELNEDSRFLEEQIIKKIY